jgi:hypothetical protein
MRSTIAALALAVTLALAACGGDSGGDDSDSVANDPEVEQTIDQLEANGAPQSQIDEVLDYAGDLEGQERSDYLELVRSMNEAKNDVDDLNAEIERNSANGCYDFDPENPINENCD